MLSSEKKITLRKIARPDYSKIGPHFKDKSKVVIDEIKRNGEKVAVEVEEKGYYSFNIGEEEIKIEKEFVKIEEEGDENLLKAGDIFIRVEK